MLSPSSTSTFTNFTSALSSSSRSLRVILPIFLLLFTVVTPTVSYSVLSSPLPSLSLRLSFFVILCTDTCVHMQAYVYSRYSFFSFYPLIASRHPLVNMIFLNSYPLAPQLCYIPLFLLFRRVSFRFLISHWCYLSYSIYNCIHFFSTPLFFYVNLVLILSFLFSASLFGERLFSLSVLPLYCTSSPPCPLFSIIISSLAFSTLYLLTRSSLYLLNSLNLLDTHHNSRAEMDFHSLRVILAYNRLSI